MIFKNTTFHLKQMEWFMRKPRWKELEKPLLKNAQRKSIWLTRTQTKMYYLTNLDDLDNSFGSFKPQETCICLHGTAGTSLGFLDLIEHFPEQTRFFFLDLPGFGKSYTQYSIQHYTTKEYLDFFSDCILEFMNILGISHVRLVGHSFGAFISIYFTHKFPQWVQNLVLISPAGLYPTLDYCAWWYALLFKLRFPYIIKIFKPLILFLFRWFPRNFLFYWLACFCDRKSFAGNVIASCITLTWKGAYWNYPVIDKIFGISKPITLFYGEQDNLTPSHQGVLAQGIYPNIHLEIVPNESHNPISSVPRLIVEHCFEQSEIHIKPIYFELEKQIGIFLKTSHRYLASIWFKQTRDTIQQFYRDLLEITRKVYQSNVEEHLVG